MGLVWRVQVLDLLGTIVFLIRTDEDTLYVLGILNGHG